MQGKGLIKVLLFLLIAVTLLQILYVLPTRKVERDADLYAQQVASKVAEADRYEVTKTARYNYLDSMSGEEIFSIPLLSNLTYDDLKKRQLALGLDLKGGMSSVLQVDLKEMLVNLSGDSRDEEFKQALNDAEAAQASSQSDYISLFAQQMQRINPDKKLSKIFMRDQGLREIINADTPNGEVVSILREKADETVKLTFNMLKQRIDKLGVTQPNVSLDESRDLIMVEMPGIDNPQRARNFLQASAALEFDNTYRINDPGVLAAFTQADGILKSASGDNTDTAVKYDSVWTQQLDSLGNETGDSTLQLVESGGGDFGTGGPLLSKLSLNNGASGVQYPLTVMGVAPKNEMKAISELLSKPNVRSSFPADAKLLWSRKPFKSFETGKVSDDYMLYMIKESPTGKAALEGDVVVSTSFGPNPNGETAVNIVMNSKGAKAWADLTGQAASNGAREIAIVLDSQVVSAPRVQNPITGGRSEITGGFTGQEAADLASILEVGKLPAKTKIVQESTVGPSLGAKNISSSLTSLLIGSILLLLFMMFYYGGAGIVSIIALLLNLLFIFGALASYGTVLTLPGIAGIILTIGMAVDANVIIYERIREELRIGKTVKAAIADGFKNSYSAIIDANVTTILVAFVLAYFGLGPIKGFAVVLIIGVLCSLFTAVLIGRMMIDWWTSKDRNISFWTGPSKNAFANLNIDWIGKRKIAYIVSGSIILLGIGSIITRGFDLGVDFRGGYSYTVEFDQGSNVDVSTLKDGLEDVFGAKPIVKAVDAQNTYNIVTTYNIGESSEEAAKEVAAQLYKGVKAITGATMPLKNFLSADSDAPVKIISSSKVGPTIADDIKKSSIYAGIFALLLIFLYIFLRFNKWQYSLGAVAALFHDSLIVLSLFSLFYGVLPFSLEIDQAFIAAILTVIGYSINDTVVVFDRIREYLGIYTKKDTDTILNMAINSTFSRTIVTSATTLIVVGILFVFGGSSIKGFAFALLVGIIVGTYSSIFVATPIVRDLSDELKPSKAPKADKSKRFSKALG
jgi:SecD/SecF fusion protein